MADVERIISELLETVIREQDIKNPEVIIKNISTGGANYTSTLHLITIKQPGNEDLKLFAKVACIGDEIRKVMQGDKIFGTERFVYKHIREIYDRIQTQNKIPESERFVFPQFYICSDKYLEETVILENLVAKGYTCYNRFETVTWEYASAAVGELAKFHALSYAFAEDDPEEFAKQVAEKTMLFSGSEEQMVEMFKKSEANVMDVVPEEWRLRLKEFFEREAGLDNFKKYYVSPRLPVFVHGDYRASNLLHKEKDGKIERLIPVDYQTLHAGSPLCDLIYFIFSGTDGEFRRHHFKQLIDHYYTTFADFLTKLGLDSEKLYPKEHFDEDFEKTLPFGLLVSIFLLPIVLVEAENIPVIDGDATMSNFIVKPNDLFKKRFLEMVEDFIDWGII